MDKKERIEDEKAEKSLREHEYSSATMSVISDNIGSLETYYQLKTADAKVVLQWCMDQGLIACEYQCPKCLQPMVLTPREDNCDQFTWSCRGYGQNAHYMKKSIRTGSWFEGSCLPIPTILLFLVYWCLEMKTKFILEQLDVTAETAADWAGFCREVCQDILISQSSKVGGPGVVVEIYESELGEYKFHQVKSVVGNWVFAGVEKGTNNCFFAVVEDCTSEVLLAVIEKYIHRGTTIISDCLKSYDCLSREGFKNLSADLDIHFLDSETQAHTNSIEGMRIRIKRDLHGTNHVQGQFDSYLAAYLWRQKNPSVDSRMRSLIDFIREGYLLPKKENEMQSTSSRNVEQDELPSSKDENEKRLKGFKNVEQGELPSSVKNGKRSKCSTNVKQEALSSSRNKNVKQSKCTMKLKLDSQSLSREDVAMDIGKEVSYILNFTPNIRREDMLEDTL